jgi:hypothetical protein
MWTRHPKACRYDQRHDQRTCQSCYLPRKSSRNMLPAGSPTTRHSLESSFNGLRLDSSSRLGFPFHSRLNALRIRCAKCEASNSTPSPTAYTTEPFTADSDRFCSGSLLVSSYLFDRGIAGRRALCGCLEWAAKTGKSFSPLGKWLASSPYTHRIEVLGCRINSSSRPTRS